MERVPDLSSPHVIEYSIKGNVPWLFSNGKQMDIFFMEKFTNKPKTKISVSFWYLKWDMNSYIEYDEMLHQKYTNLICSDRHWRKSGRKAVGYTETNGLMCSKHCK